ncbi:MAG: hypothetical protein PVSMB2_23690 [Ktedonobacteraceae bacterium]
MVPVFALLGIEVLFAIVCSSRIFLRKASCKSFLATGIILVLLLLSGCGNPATSGSQPAQVTPLALTPGTIVTKTTSQGSADWPTYHRDNTRAGYLANMPDPQQLTSSWNTKLDGAVYGEPLVVNGHIIVATENDTLYSLNAQTGQVVWHTNVGTPVAQADLPCGNIFPLGITGTPVYDPVTGLVFAIAEITAPTHILVGLDVTTGQVKVRRVADPHGIEVAPHQQRAALALFGNRVYVAYGGLDGDCGNYHGWVVGSQTDGNGPLLTFEVPTPREGGIWAASGPAIDAAGHVFVAVGNGETTEGNWDHSDSVLRLSPTLKLEDGFTPQNWQQENAQDADLGSMGPLLLPDNLLFADGKSGLGYLLHANALGGVNGQAQVLTICHSFGGAATTGSQIFVPCTSGLRQLLLDAQGQLVPGWQAPSQITGSPVIGGHTVYSLGGDGILYALDSATGKVRANVMVGEVSHFATPTLSGNHIYVGTLSGVTAIVGT